MKGKSKIGRRYGWRPQLPDFRDFKYKASPHILKALPPLVDLRNLMPPVQDQQTIGSCVSHGVAGGYKFEEIKQLLANGNSDPVAVASAVAQSIDPSRLFIYYGAREIEGTVNEDSGAEIRDGVKVVVNQGVCDEKMWPYDISKFTNKPTDTCYTEALKHQVLSYHAVAQSIEEMKGCLAEGYPFVIGISVYESFESSSVAQTGIVPMPGRNESQLGGHCLLAVGYDDSKQWFIVRNSWSENWGKAGYCFIPYAYLTNPGLASDFWTIRMIEIEDSPIPTPEPPTPSPDPVPTPDPTPTPTPSPTPPCDCSLAFPMAKQFLDAAVVELNKGKSTEEAMSEGLKAAQMYAGRMQPIRSRSK